MRVDGRHDNVGQLGVPAHACSPRHSDIISLAPLFSTALEECDRWGVDLDEIADELYGLRPADFTAARDSRVAAVKKAGDRELAKTIASLRRPTLGAWLINALVRARPDLIDRLADLGESMRTAQDQFAGEELRLLSRERMALINDLEADARNVAEAAGQPVTDSMAGDLRSTLEAALADPEVAAVVRAGRLTTALSHSGFGLLGSAAVETVRPARRPAKKVPEPTGLDDKVDHREVARANLSEAEQTLGMARADARAAARDVADASKKVEKLDKQIADLDEQLATLREKREVAANERERHDAALARAHDAVQHAERRLEAIKAGGVATD
jgi:hypothetical protein